MASRFILLGGFLGAGKTTTLARLARQYQSQGRHVAIITNDKAPELVDTLNLMAQGYKVAELAGTCFCGNVDELVAAVDGFQLAAVPDVVLAEPVGSCIDMVATVIKPLARQYATRFDVAPYGVLLKPSHGLKILRDGLGAGFSPQAAYLFRKQLEESDFVAINRIDQLTAEQISELTGLIERDYPGRPLLPISAKTGDGFAALAAQLESMTNGPRRDVTVDYDAYAAGEASLGWLNAGLIFQAAQPFSIDGLLLALVEEIGTRLRTVGLETAHLKVLAQTGGISAVANLVSNELPAELSRSCGAEAQSVQLTINARVAGSPDELVTAVRAAITALADRHLARVDYQQLQSFRPGQPVKQSAWSMLPGSE